MSKDHIRYDLLVQNALKSVVRKVLADASRDGMPPDHHFYVSFRTNVAGTKISTRLREKYPEEMTIVLQHQYWDLNVGESQFEVGLSFAGIPERLVVPFDTITGFYDPSVEFGLKFEVKDEAETPVSIAPVAVASDDDPVPALRPFTPRSLRDRATSGASAREDGELIARIGDGAKTTKQRTAKDSEPGDAVLNQDDDSHGGATPDAAASDAIDATSGSEKSPAKTASPAKEAASAADKADAIDDAAEPAPEKSGAQVVSLDAFRKKH